MANYEYEAWDAVGTHHRGLKQAGTEEEILAWLREQDLTPVAVNPIFTGAAVKKRAPRYKRVNSGDLGNFCWQLSTMIEGGLPITTATETIADDMENRYFGSVLDQVAEGMEQGGSFSDSIKKFPKIFNALSCAMITAGESGGTLAATLHRLADYYENRDKLVRKVKSAITYPSFVVGFIIFIVIVLMTFIIPRFRTIFDQIGGELPAFTRAFMAVYDVMMSNFFLGIALVIMAVVGVHMYNRTEKGHKVISKFVLALPLFGKIISQAFLAIFCRTLSTLLASGIPILEAFEILSKMTNNDVLKTAVVTTRKRVVEGSSISLSMAASGFFPNVAVKMTQVGEESGSLPEVLDKTADYYEKKVNSMVDAMIALLEPILIVTVGAIVLVVVLAMYLPIFMISDIKG